MIANNKGTTKKNVSLKQTESFKETLVVKRPYEQIQCEFLGIYVYTVFLASP